MRVRARIDGSGCLRSVLLALALALAGNASGHAAAEPPKVAGSAVAPVSSCDCADQARIRDRLAQLKGARSLLQGKLRAAATAGAEGATTPATAQVWAATQQDFGQYLAAMQMLGAAPGAKAANPTLFGGEADPFCDRTVNAGSSCLDASYAAHQSVHASSCRAGNWNWRNAWSAKAMQEEELAALGAEIGFLEAQPGCTAAQPCPQFQLVVQVVTTSAYAGGGIVEGSARSLNAGQGINVPLILQPDGSYTGQGSGVDAGAAALRGSGISAASQFGHQQSIVAQAQIHPGSCTSLPCQPDILHVVLSGFAAPQSVQGQMTAPISRNFAQTTPGGAANMVFDLPAYVGGSASRVLLAMGIVNSNMGVMVVQVPPADPRAGSLPQGSSLLSAQRQCLAAAPAPASQGATGTVSGPP